MNKIVISADGNTPSEPWQSIYIYEQIIEQRPHDKPALFGLFQAYQQINDRIGSRIYLLAYANEVVCTLDGRAARQILDQVASVAREHPGDVRAKGILAELRSIAKTH